MEREEIVKALRAECDDCSECSRIDGKCAPLFYCANRDAADLIEQQATRIAELETEAKEFEKAKQQNRILPEKCGFIQIETCGTVSIVLNLSALKEQERHIK